MAAFPNVYKVKCIPHARRGAWLSPGHVLVVVVPNLRNANAVNPLAPKVDADTLSRIDELLHRRAGAQTQIAVVNPSYQQVQLDLKVSFQPGHEFNFYSEKLKQELIKLLSPWAFDQGREIVFGGSLHKSLLLDRVEHLDYVDYVTDFKMYSYIGATPRANDLNEVRADAPDAILVSAPSHVVDRVQ